MREQIKIAPNSHSIENLNIFSISLSVGLKNVIYKFFRCLRDLRSTGLNCKKKNAMKYAGKV